MHRIILFLISICCVAELSAQVNEELNEKELLQALTGAKEDSNKVGNLRELAEYYLGPKTDTSLVLAQEAINLAEKIKDEKGKAKALFTMGKVFVYMGNYNKALELYFQSLELNNRLNNLTYACINLNYIGEVYGYQGDYQQSLFYYFKGKTIAEKNQLTLLPRILLNIGKTYESMNQLDSARQYIQTSYELTKKIKDDYLPGKILFSLGEINARSGDAIRAMEYYRLSIVESANVEDYAITCDASLGIANLLNSTGNKDSALYYARKSYTLAGEADFLPQKLNATNFLAGYFKEKKLYDSAFAYLEISFLLKDSLLSKEKISEFQKISFSEQLRQQESEQAQVQYRNKIKMFILLGGLSALLIVAIILWRNIRIKQKANTLLTAQKLEIDKQKDKIETSYRELKTTQAQLIQSEKMASLGELTAGIAHEIQNPLNFVNNFSEVNNELIRELKTEKLKMKAERNDALENELLSDIENNLEKINHHGKRAESIVKGMLQHSRSSSGKKELTNINELADEYLRLAWHGLRAKEKSFNATFHTDFDPMVGNINIVPQDIGRVLLNLYSNAFYAAPLPPPTGGGFKDSHNKHEPIVWVSTKKKGDKVFISVKDNGPGIPQKVIDKIFQPFFTTKPTGQGTGLGLSLSYDIIKAHGGEIKVETKEGAYAEFIIQLPVT